MDGRNFDDLLRTLTTLRSRRRLVRTMGGAFAVLGIPGLSHVAADDAAAKKKKKKKKPPVPPPGCTGTRELCGGTCVDIKTDPDNCGGCGEACGTGKTCCRWNCVDILESEDHCGACGNACDSGEVCVAGTCSNCTQGFICGGTVPFCDLQYECACTSVLEGGAACAWKYCSDETCTSTQYCIDTYGPGSVCQAPGTGCCGQKCSLACPSVADRAGGRARMASEPPPGSGRNF